jgi:hypothetical protein
MNDAENLIVEAVFNNYLRNTTSYAAIRTAMVNAAKALNSGQYGNVALQVEKAWYAVGVGNNVPVISGPDLINQCNTDITYTLVDSHPSSVSVTWSGYYGLTLSNPTRTSVTVRLTTPSSAGALIEAHFSNGEVASKMVLTGFNSSYTQPTFISLSGVKNTIYTLPSPTSALVPGATGFSWSVANTIPSSYYSLTMSSGGVSYIQFYQPGSYTVLGYPYNSCWGMSSGARVIIYYTITNSGSYAPPYPNPVSDILNLEDMEDDVDIYLYDSFGAAKKNMSITKGSKASINVSKLPNGIYVLRIYPKNGKAPVNFKVIVEH